MTRSRTISGNANQLRIENAELGIMTYIRTKWIYENDQDNQIRYVLGTRGENPLLCFGINPSTAKPNNLDMLKSVHSEFLIHNSALK